MPREWVLDEEEGPDCAECGWPKDVHYLWTDGKCVVPLHCPVHMTCGHWNHNCTCDTPSA